MELIQNYMVEHASNIAESKQEANSEIVEVIQDCMIGRDADLDESAFISQEPAERDSYLDEWELISSEE